MIDNLYKKPVIHDVEQRSEEWQSLRLGVVTASKASVIASNGKGADTYLNEIISSILTGYSKPFKITDAIEHGNEYEQAALNAYMFDNGDVEKVGFVKIHDLIGCSPDGIVGDNGLVELKCPNSDTHIGYIISDEIPKDYLYQMLFQLFVTGREWCDFVSYDPRIYNPHNIFIKRVSIELYPNEYQKLINNLELFIGKLKNSLNVFGLNL